MLDEICEYLECHKGKIAYINHDETVTYEELLTKAQRLADNLKRQGEGPVIIYGHKETYVVISILACLLASRAYIPLDYYIPLERIKEIVSISKAELIITNKNLELSNIEIKTIDELESYHFKAFKEINNDIAYIIFTSGSTGYPKAVPIKRANLNHFIKWITNHKSLKDYQATNILNTASFSFDLSVCDLYYGLFKGHTIKAYDSLTSDFKYLYELLQDIEIAVMTPSFMKLLLCSKDFNKLNYPCLKIVFFCGERLEKSLCQELFKRFKDVKIINAYGPSEATCVICSSLITIDDLNDTYLPSGDINDAACDIKIIDNEIALKGESVFKGYLNGLEINEYHSGDYGYIKDAKLYVEGRRDRQIKYKGYRIELNEIERALMSLDGVNDAIVDVLKDDLGTILKIKAILISKRSLNDIKRELKTKLPSYMIPDVINIKDDLRTIIRKESNWKGKYYED